MSQHSNALFHVILSISIPDQYNRAFAVWSLSRVFISLLIRIYQENERKNSHREENWNIGVTKQRSI